MHQSKLQLISFMCIVFFFSCTSRADAISKPIHRAPAEIIIRGHQDVWPIDRGCCSSDFQLARLKQRRFSHSRFRGRVKRRRSALKSKLRGRLSKQFANRRKNRLSKPRIHNKLRSISRRNRGRFKERLGTSPNLKIRRLFSSRRF